MDFDWKNNMIYVADIGKQEVYRLRIDEQDPSASNPKAETVLKHSVHGIEGMAVDWIGRKLYFLNKNEQRLYVCELNGTHCTVLLEGRFTQPRALTVYPQKG